MQLSSDQQLVLLELASRPPEAARNIRQWIRDSLADRPSFAFKDDQHVVARLQPEPARALADFLAESPRLGNTEVPWYIRHPTLRELLNLLEQRIKPRTQTPAKRGRGATRADWPPADKEGVREAVRRLDRPERAELEEQDPWHWVRVARLLRLVDEPDDARRVARQIEANLGGSLGRALRTTEAAADCDLEDWSEAGLLIDRVLSANERDWRALRVRARVLRAQGDIEGADECDSKADEYERHEKGRASRGPVTGASKETWFHAPL